MTMIAQDVVNFEQYVDDSVPHTGQHQGLVKPSRSAGCCRIKRQFFLLSQ